jgi:hypothetical protein
MRICREALDSGLRRNDRGYCAALIRSVMTGKIDGRDSS